MGLNVSLSFCEKPQSAGKHKRKDSRSDFILQGQRLKYWRTTTVTMNMKNYFEENKTNNLATKANCRNPPAQPSKISFATIRTP